ncbi:MAG: Npt1/Npt2 family nucleotide transporter [Vigna little leaf phytoplasma]|nr:Npt1/Npt2 family nucleotide transporter [Vigna little leaf phytoplasma]
MKTNFLTKIKDTCFPIKKNELHLFIPSAILFLLILFVFSCLRICKDSLMVPVVGSECIPFAKTYFVLPMTILFTMSYIYLSNKFNKETLFIMIITMFLFTFIFFAFIFSSSIDSKYSSYYINDGKISDYISKFPQWMKYPLILYGKWPILLLYFIAELWGVAMLVFLFWQTMNNLVSLEVSKRFYPSLGLVANLGLPLAGIISSLVSKSFMAYKFMLIMIISSLLILIVYKWLMYVSQKYKSNFRGSASINQLKSDKLKLGFWESLKVIASSKKILFILFLVLGYGVTINLVEGPWKAQLRIKYANEKAYKDFMSKFMILTGLLTITFMVIGQNILKYLGWFAGAISTPLIILCTGAILFLAIMFKDFVGVDRFGFSSASILTFIVFLGTLQNLLSKASKYSLFDPTKEMSFLQLDDELKNKGKAAVDMIGGRLAKSLGGFIQSILLIGHTMTDIVPILSILFLFFSFIWIYAVYGLNNLLFKHVKE